jgi:hypothetical protein
LQDFGLVVFGDIPGNKFVNFILLKFPGTYLVLVFHYFNNRSLLSVISLLWRTNWRFRPEAWLWQDIKKLDGILADMNELRN